MRLKYLGHLGLILVAGLLATFLPHVEQLKTGGPLNTGDTAWMLTASGLVLLMTPGLSFFYGGMVRSKHVLGMLMQNVFAMGVISVAWAVVGFSLAFGGSNRWSRNDSDMEPLKSSIGEISSKMSSRPEVSGT